MAAGTIALPTSVDQTKAINPWLIAITVTLATFMELLDTAIANVSLPRSVESEENPKAGKTSSDT